MTTFTGEAPKIIFWTLETCKTWWTWCARVTYIELGWKFVERELMHRLAAEVVLRFPFEVFYLPSEQERGGGGTMDEETFVKVSLFAQKRECVAIGSKTV